MLWRSGLSPGSWEDWKKIWVVLGKQEYFGVMRQLSPSLIALQSFLKCHQFGLRRESSDFLLERVASCKLASMINKTIAIWLRAYVSSPTLGRYEVSEAKTDASERILSSGNCQFSFVSWNLTHRSRAHRERVIAMTPWADPQGRNASVSFYRWLRVAVMIHNPIPHVQGLFPMPCLVLSNWLLRRALAVWGTCHSENKTLAAPGVSVIHTHKQCGNISNGKSLPGKMMVISAVAQVNWITEGWPATWTPRFVVLPVMSYDPWPILPAYREAETLSGMGAHLKIQNGHGLTAGRKQGRVFLVALKCNWRASPHRVTINSASSWPRSWAASAVGFWVREEIQKSVRIAQNNARAVRAGARKGAAATSTRGGQQKGQEHLMLR